MSGLPGRASCSGSLWQRSRMSGARLGNGSVGDLSPKTLRSLAALIAADAAQLEERAQQSGVTAFLGRPVQREKPNERFLQNTIRNLASANKRQEEKAMWAAREADKQSQPPLQEQQRQRQDAHEASRRRTGPDASPIAARRAGGRHGHDSSQSGGRKRSRSRSRSRSPGQYRSSTSRSRSRSPAAKQRRSSGGRSPAGRSDHDKRTHRARSRSCSRSADSGGSAPASAADPGAADPAAAHSSGDWSEGDEAADEQLLQWLGNSTSVRGRGSIGPRADVAGPYLPLPSGSEQLREPVSKGPAKPSWLQGAADDEPRLKPNTAFLRGVLASQGIAAGTARSEGAAAAGSDGSSGSISSGSSGSSGRRRSSKKRKRDSSSKRKKHKKHKKSKRHKDKKSSKSSRK